MMSEVLLASVLLSLPPLVRGVEQGLSQLQGRAVPECDRVCVFVCLSALVSIVVVHWGWDAGHYRGASSSCKVTCYSWTCQVTCSLRL